MGATVKTSTKNLSHVYDGAGNVAIGTPKGFFLFFFFHSRVLELIVCFTI